MTTRSTKEEDLNEFKAQLESLRAEVSALSANLQALLEGQDQAGAETAQAEAGSVEGTRGDLEALQRKIADLRESGSAAAEELSREVAAHPLLSLGVAFGAGYLLARITGVFR